MATSSTPPSGDSGDVQFNATNDYQAFLNEWKTRVKNKEYEECAETCRESLASGSIAQHAVFRSKIRNLYGVLLAVHLGKGEEAREQYELSVKDDPSNASAHYNWATLCKNFFNDLDGAEKHYGQAIALKPDHIGYRNNFGLLLENRHKYNEAREQYTAAIQLSPGNGRAHNNMANLLKRRFNDYETAAYHYEKSIELDPTNPIRHFNYGLLLRHNLQRPSDAAMQFEKALDLDPDYDEAHQEYRSYLMAQTDSGAAKHCLRYGIWLLWSGRTQDARVMLNKTVALDSGNAVAQAVLNPAADSTTIFSSPVFNQEMEALERLVDQKNDVIRVLTRQQGGWKSRQKRDGIDLLSEQRKLLHESQRNLATLRDEIENDTEIQDRLSQSCEDMARCVSRCADLELWIQDQKQKSWREDRRTDTDGEDSGYNDSEAEQSGAENPVGRMELRHSFLLRSQESEQVQMPDREVARWITHEYFRPNPLLVSHSTLPSLDSDHKTPEQMQSWEDRRTSATLTGVTRIERLQRFTTKASVARLLSDVDNWDFDVFEFTNECRRYSLAVLMIEICKSRGIFEFVDINPELVVNYMVDVADEYFDNPYHNKAHACDVTANAHYFMLSDTFGGVSALEQLACLMAAAVHDVGHPGHNNNYESNIQSELAIRYNDNAILEQYHAAKAWQILKKERCNFLTNLSSEDVKRFRKMLIDAVLATDMTSHSAQYTTLTQLIEKVFESTGTAPISRTSLDGINLDGINIESQVLIPLTIHTADLSNPTKPIKYYDVWADAIMDEFWRQGDREREQDLPISSLCDRTTVDKPTCQVGFINYVIRPWFLAWCKLLGEGRSEVLIREMEANFKVMEGQSSKAKAQKAQREHGGDIEVDGELKSDSEPGRSARSPRETPSPRLNENDENNERDSSGDKPDSARKRTPLRSRSTPLSPLIEAKEKPISIVGLSERDMIRMDRVF